MRLVSIGMRFAPNNPVKHLTEIVPTGFSSAALGVARWRHASDGPTLGEPTKPDIAKLHLGVGRTLESAVILQK